jgi:hypothetical protein
MSKTPQIDPCEVEIVVARLTGLAGLARYLSCVTPPDGGSVTDCFEALANAIKQEADALDAMVDATIFEPVCA